MIFLNAFSASIQMKFFFLLFFIMSNYINWCSKAKLTLYSWNKPHLVMIWFAKNLIIFAPMFMRDIDLEFYFFTAMFYWFWCQGNDGFIEWFGNYSFLWMFLEKVCVELIFLPYKFGRILQWVTGAWSFIYGKVLLHI